MPFKKQMLYFFDGEYQNILDEYQASNAVRYDGFIQFLKSMISVQGKYLADLGTNRYDFGHSIIVGSIKTDKIDDKPILSFSIYTGGVDVSSRKQILLQHIHVINILEELEKKSLVSEFNFCNDQSFWAVLV